MSIRRQAIAEMVREGLERRNLQVANARPLPQCTSSPEMDDLAGSFIRHRLILQSNLITLGSIVRDAPRVLMTIVKALESRIRSHQGILCGISHSSTATIQGRPQV